MSSKHSRRCFSPPRCSRWISGIQLASEYRVQQPTPGSKNTATRSLMEDIAHHVREAEFGETTCFEPSCAWDLTQHALNCILLNHAAVLLTVRRVRTVIGQQTYSLLAWGGGAEERYPLAVKPANVFVRFFTLFRV